MVIFSCVRARPAGGSGGVGFLADVRRMNVAFTRARCEPIRVCMSGVLGAPGAAAAERKLHSVPSPSSLPRLRRPPDA